MKSSGICIVHCKCGVHSVLATIPITHTHNMQSFLGGADCAANANPLAGMMKREAVDRSVLRVSWKVQEK